MATGKKDVIELLRNAGYDPRIHDASIYILGAEEVSDADSDDTEIRDIRSMLPEGWGADYTGNYSDACPDIVIEPPGRQLHVLRLGGEA